MLTWDETEQFIQQLGHRLVDVDHQTEPHEIHALLAKLGHARELLWHRLMMLESERNKDL